MLGKRLRPYRRLQAFCLLAVFGYLGAALFLGFTAKRDAFPLFSWSLFSYVPTIRHDFAILITELDGRPVEPPRDLMDCQGLLSGAGDIHAYYTIQDLGDAIVRRDQDQMAALRRLLESEYLTGPAGEVRYRLIARAYDPVEKWRHGTYRQQKVADLRRASPP